MHSEHMQVLGMLSVKLEAEMRFDERDAVEYAIGKLSIAKKGPTRKNKTSTSTHKAA